MKALRIFVSSPGDVGRERVIASHVIKQLQGEFSRRAELRPYFWEHEPMRASTDFQGNIPRPSDFDIVICILWSRLGSPLNEDYRRADGTPYASGTEYEFEDSIRGRQLNGRPELLIYRNRQKPMIPIEPEEERNEKIRQFDALQSFLKRWFLHSDGTVRIATNDYEDLAVFEEKLERDLRALVSEATRGESNGSAAAKPVATYARGSPFRQLRSFDFEDADIFFGRTKAIDEVLTAMREQAAEGSAFTLITGSSGSGKSSLARAGVLPIMVRPGVIEGIGLWRRAIIRPGNAATDLFAGLAEALVDKDALPELTSDGLSSAELARALAEAPAGVTLLIKRSLGEIGRAIQVKEGLNRPVAARLVILVDQFEELFSRGDAFPAEVCMRFIAALAEFARSGVVWLLATLRSEFFNRCEQFPELVKLKGRKGQYQLLAPTNAQLRQMVRLPAMAAGLRFEVDVEGHALDDVIVDSAGNNPGSLPLLEFSLEELYKRRRDDCWLTHSALHEIGGIEGAVEVCAEALFARLPPDAQAQLGGVFRSLVTVSINGQHAFIRRIAQMAEVGGTSARHALIDALIDARLLVSGLGVNNEPTIQVAHEALFLHWPRLFKIIEKDRDFLRRRARAAAAFGAWDSENRHRSYLWSHGRLLAEAKSLLAGASDLSSCELEFVRESVDSGKRIRRARAAGLTTAAIVAIVAGTSLLLWWHGWRTKTQLANWRDQLTRMAANSNASAFEIAEVSGKILALAPDDTPIREINLKALVDAGRDEDFKAALASWKQSAPLTPKIEDVVGDFEHKHGNDDTAVHHWMNFLRTPGLDLQQRSQAWAKLADAEGRLQRWDQVRAATSEWIRAQDNVHARLLRAKAKQHLRDWEGARTDFDFAEKADPSNPEIKGFAGMFDSGAIAGLNERVSRAPRDPAAWLARGIELARSRQFEAALEDVNHTLTLDPDSTRAVIEKAHLLWQLDRPLPQALGARIAPTWTKDEGAFSSSFTAMERELTLLNELDTRIKRDSNNPELYLERARKLGELQQYVLALRDYSRVLTLDPQSIKTLQARAEMYNHLGKQALAAEDLKKASELSRQPAKTR